MCNGQQLYAEGYYGEGVKWYIDEFARGQRLYISKEKPNDNSPVKINPDVYF